MSKVKIKRICPVCGRLGSGIYARWVLNKTKKRYEPYYYFAHKYKQNGKWKIKWCYVPKEVALKYISQEPIEKGDKKSFQVEFREEKPKGFLKRLIERIKR